MLLGFSKLCSALSYLFVGKDKQHSIPQLVLRQHPRQLLSCLVHSLPIVTVHNKYQACERDRGRLSMCLRVA